MSVALGACNRRKNENKDSQNQYTPPSMVMASLQDRTNWGSPLMYAAGRRKVKTYYFYLIETTNWTA